MKTTTEDTITKSTVSEAADALDSAAEKMAILSEAINDGDIPPAAAHDILMEQTAAAIFAAAEAGLHIDIPIDTLSALTEWLGYETFDETAEHFACTASRKVTLASE
jgi:hypothetical protein